MKLETIEEE